MRIWGKVLGFLFGFMLSKHILGALFGAWLGHRFDKGLGLNFNSLAEKNMDEASRQAIFFYTTFSVMGHVAKAKGKVTSHEIAFASAYMNKLGLNNQMRKQAQDAFNEGKAPSFPFNDRLKQFKNTCSKRDDLLRMFMEIQIQVAFSDGDLDKEERSVLHRIAKLLGFSARELDSLLEMIIASESFHQSDNQTHSSNKKPATASQQSNAYKVLGVSEKDSLSVIKKAYKKLMSQHHPDKLIAKGLPPEMMEDAKQKTQDIQAAYDIIIKNTK